MLFRRRPAEHDLDAELSAHLDLEIRENIARGLSPEDARRAALRKFGNVALAKERTREAWGWTWLETLTQDFRYALRTLRRSPAFTVVAVLTLSLGIGANTAIFSVVNAVLLRPLPYKESDRLVVLEPADSRYNAKVSFSYRAFESARSQSQSFEEMAIYYLPGWSRRTLTGVAEPEIIQAAFVSENFFPLVGTPPLVGRFVEPEDVRHRDRVVVLSEALWQRRFAGARSVIGATLEIDGQNWTVIGVMPSSLELPYKNTQCWMPLTAHEEFADKEDALNSRRWNVLARLRPGVTVEQAQSEMSTIAARLAQQYPETNAGTSIFVTPLRRLVAGNVRLALGVLLGAVFFVLLIACSNVANLVLARGTAREREFAVRAALGAGRGRLLRQVLTESIALSLLAGLAGLLLAAGGTRVLIALGPLDTPRLGEARIDTTVLLFALLISLTAGAFFGLFPAWKVSRHDPNESLKQGGRTMAGAPALRRVRDMLVVAEFGLAVVLLAGAGLLLRSFLAVEAVDPGVKVENLLTVRVSFSAATPGARQYAFFGQAMERLARLPGVEAVGASNSLFILSEPRSFSFRQVEGRPPEPREHWTPLEWSTVGGDYFHALGIPLLRGRFFSNRDTPESPPVTIINETLARRYWPGEDPIGKRVKGFDPRGRNDDWVTVVGLVGDIRARGRDRQPMAQIFQPRAQWRDTTPIFVIRTATRHPMEVATAVRALLRSVDPAAVLTEVTTVEQQLREQTFQRRFQAWLFGLSRRSPCCSRPSESTG